MIPQQKMSFRDFLLDFFFASGFGEDFVLKVSEMRAMDRN